MIKTTQKAIKSFMDQNGVIDITRSENTPRPDEVLFYSAGVNGVNGAVYSAGGRLYGTACRCSNLFIVF